MINFAMDQRRFSRGSERFDLRQQPQALNDAYSFKPAKEITMRFRIRSRLIAVVALSGALIVSALRNRTVAQGGWVKA